MSEQLRTSAPLHSSLSFARSRKSTYHWEHGGDKMKAHLDLISKAVSYPPFSENAKAREGDRISSQLYFWSGDDKDQVIAYAPYEDFAALLSLKEHEWLVTHPACDSSIPPDLSVAGFYGQSSEIAKMPTKQHFFPSEVTVFLGDACNLSCVYCNATRSRGGSYSSARAIQGLKAIIDKYPIEHIGFFGNGEPTLYFSAIRAITELARSRGISSLYLTTNGVFREKTPEYVQFIVEKGIYTQISIDGPPKVHNSQRPFPDGDGSLKEVMRTLDEFKKHGDMNKFCFARFTLTRYAGERLNDIILFLHDIGFKKIRFAELIPEGRAREQGDTGFAQSANPLEIVDIIVEAFVLADSLGIDLTGDCDPRGPSESGIFPCPFMAGRAVALNKSLELLACLEDNKEWMVGTVDIAKEDVRIYWDKVVALRKRNMLAFKECASCPVKCGGGCTHLSHLRNGDLSTPGDYAEKCEALRRILAGYLKVKLVGGAL